MNGRTLKEHELDFLRERGYSLDSINQKWGNEKILLTLLAYEEIKMAYQESLVIKDPDMGNYYLWQEVEDILREYGE